MTTSLVHDCERCGEKSARITDSRPSPLPNVKRKRRYKCDNCGYSWRTHEISLSKSDDPLVHDGRMVATMFLDDVEKAAREHFGDERGRMFSGRKR